MQNSVIFSILGAQERLFRPESARGQSGQNTFINTRSWEVFWRPRAAKVRLGPKSLKFHPKTGFPSKIWFLCEIWKVAKFLEFYTKPYHFCFKKVVENPILLFLEPLSPKSLNFVKFTKFLGIPGNLVKFWEIWGVLAIFAKKGDSGQNDKKCHFRPFWLIFRTFSSFLSKIMTFWVK